MSAVLVRYRVKPDRAAENAELVRAVYEPPQTTRRSQQVGAYGL